MSKTPVIKKEKLMHYLMYAHENIDITQLVQYLAAHSEGKLRLTTSSRNKSDWNIER
jgi:hypothetical protein